MKYISFFIVIYLIIPCAILAQPSVIGKWKTIDDETGKAKSVVELYESDGELFGKIVKLYREQGEDPDPICDKCPVDDSRYNTKVIGMVIIKNMKKSGDEYEGGTVLKPDEGKIYKCKIWLDKGNLQVRGYWGMFYRTQSWVKYQ
ncbi:MAG TPA: DUF2147 domain-containing protein [Fulvivirga sp.]|nr:DUF2147 domain-containing protein [Fulvivirga sp.]